MEQKYCDELARLRLERAIELLDESEDLLKEEKYKSANNRSYYAMEKAIKALLALKGVDAATHSGNLKQFNYHYVFHGDGTFTPDDYQPKSRVISTQIIRRQGPQVFRETAGLVP